MKLEALFCLGLAVLALQVYGASIPTPFDSKFNLSCGNSAGLVGGYSAANLTAAQPIGIVVFDQWWRENYFETPCSQTNIISNTTNVTQACSQVVAGTNYALLLKASAKCPANDTSNPNVQSRTNMTFAAKVYQPLGNTAPQVTYSELLNIVEEDI